MRKRFYSSVLAMLLCMTGTTVWADVVHISTAEQLRNVAENNTDYVLDNDIDLEGNMPRKWHYGGTFDGNGHTIYNVPRTGLFSAPDGGAVFKNLTIENTSTLTTDNGYGSIAAYSRGSITFENCVSKVNMTGSGLHMVGGFIGEAHGAGSTVTFINCRNEGETNGSFYETGGFIGLDADGVNVTFTGCMNLGDVKSNSSYGIGGFIGHAHSSGTYTFTNCGNMGTILCGSGYDEACAFIGRSSGTIALTNCWNSGQTGKYENNWQNYPLTQNGTGTFTNCYDVYNGTSGVTQIAAADVAGGALCYLLNGDQSTITFYQNLDNGATADTYPVLNSTHGQVYRIGAYQCDGVTAKAGAAGYTNTSGTSTVDEHNFVGGVCSVCGAYDPADIVDGVYHIGSAAQLTAFRTKASNTSGALLTANIDMAGQGWVAMTGYAGIFDGGGYTISNLGTPLFRTTGNVTIKNLTLAKDEAQEVSFYPYSPFICTAQGNTTIENCVNETAIARANAHSVGGFIGNLNGNGMTITITNCQNRAEIFVRSKATAGFIGADAVDGYYTRSNNVTISNSMNLGKIWSDEDWGIGGFIGMSGTGTYTFTNCGNTGTIICNNNYNEACAFIGRTSGGGTIALTNCWNSGVTMKWAYNGSDTENWGTGTQANLPLTQNGTGSFTNCYDVYNGDPSGVTQIAAADVASGALCFLLNGSVSGGTTFYQTLGTDAYPVTDNTRSQVYQKGTVRCDGVTPVAGATVEYLNTAASPTVQPHNFVDGVCDFCGTYDPADIVGGVYHIGTAAQLTAFRTKASTTSGALLTANIDMAGQGWSPMTSYAGIFDGGGYTISNLGTALFRSTGNVTIKNLTLAKDEAQEVTWYPFSPFICNAQGNTTIENCVNETAIARCNAHSIGGFIGRVDTNGKTINITGCTNKGEILCMSKWVAGIIGIGNANTVNLTNCMNIADIKGEDYAAGGLIGEGGNGGTYTYLNCGNMGDIACNPSFSEACALMGRASGTIIATNCWNSGKTYRYPDTEMSFPLTQNGTGTFTNCYDVYNGDPEGVTQIAAANVADGGLTYQINHGAGSTIFYQTVDEDSYPVFDTNHGRVGKMGAAGYATYFDATTAGTFSSGVTVYTVNEKATGYVKLAEQANTIPASTAVILKGTEGEVSYFSFTPAASASAISGTNLLEGTSTDITATGSEYVLAMPEGATEVGLYPMKEGATIPAGKAYLSDGNGVKGFVFSFDDDITGINIATSADLQNDIIYNVAGQRVQKMQKGINIVSGKKVLVK